MRLLGAPLTQPWGLPGTRHVFTQNITHLMYHCDVGSPDLYVVHALTPFLT
eukprot:m.4943 g.4943  ORF g.4943 m.4943 type:complete len:51 (-) comp3877_c0_seq1:118-270(-)